MICMTLRVASCLVSPILGRAEDDLAKRDGVMGDTKSGARATPASMKQVQKEGIVVSVGLMGGCTKSTPRIYSKALSSL